MRIVTFGEIMMRLNHEGYNCILQADRLEISYAGGEANVAVSLANYGQDVSFVTRLPENLLGESARNALRHFGVDTKNIIWGGNRLGLYFVEKGASQRASKVIYDRAGSAIATAKRSDFDWDEIFKGAGWFHFTGITPALGGELPGICLDALEYCHAHNITVSCDINYRGKLWTREKARRIMTQLVAYVDILIANEADASDVFGIIGKGSDVESGKLNKEGYISVAEQLAECFGVDMVAVTLRTSLSATDNLWAGMLYDARLKNACFSNEYIIHIVDRVGGGDSFAGALIYALCEGKDTQATIDFAVAASCLKHSIEHDFNLVSVNDVESLAAGNVTGRVQR